MKTILYSIIAILIFTTFAAGLTGKSNPRNSILIQATDKAASVARLAQSAQIISARLKEFSPEQFTVSVIPEKMQIRVVVSPDLDLKAIRNLLTAKGALAVYETYDRKSLTELLEGDTRLFTLLNISNSMDYGAKIGCASVSGDTKVKEYLKSLGLDQKCRFIWDSQSGDSEECLYVLKINGEKGPLLVKSEIENVQSGQSKMSKINDIEIRIKESAVHLWAEATERNIGHAIAIVMDNHILAAPIVRSVITGGKCEISGNFTQTEAKSIASLGNNGELPLNFRIVK